MTANRNAIAAPALAAPLALILALALAACGNPFASGGGGTPAYASYLFMTDTTSGRVYTYDPALGTASAQSLLTVEGGAGPIAFRSGLAYVPVGNNWAGNAAGLYRFDPSAAKPVAKLLTSGALSAQHLAFAESSSLAFFTVAGSADPSKDGLYWFDASSASPAMNGPIAGTANFYLQQVIVGDDGYVYAARQNYYGAAAVHEVLKVDAVKKTVEASFASSAAGATALCKGSWRGSVGIFVGNTGGSVDFLATATSPQTILKILDLSANRLLALSAGRLLVAGWNNCYVADGTATTTAVTELLDGTASFGAVDLALKDGTAYIACNVYGQSSRLYSFQASGSGAAGTWKTVMTNSDNIAGMGFYRN